MKEKVENTQDREIIKFAELFLGYELYPVQKEILLKMVTKPFNNFIWEAARQSGKSDLIQTYIILLLSKNINSF
jgi:hypothetical protein